ncbi:MAG: hypothetical protein AB7O97_13365 [Planctomycetota bacterium]
MIVKGLFAAAVVSTPLCLVSTQDPATPVRSQARVTTTAVVQEPGRGGQAAERELDQARRDLERAQRHIDKLERQLEQALDALEATFEPERERNCAPSRSRALMSHYQWLRQNDHPQRAQSTLAKVVDRVGDDVNRLNSVAWNLMTDQETTGKFDEVALALAERMEAQGEGLHHRHLDTVALARFLNGQVERAVALQQLAIAKGGNGDDYRRRLRTYQAAQVALAKAHGEAARARADGAALASADDE